MFDWSDVTRRFKDLASLIDTKPVFRWGVITNADPLLVQLDGDERPIAGSPSTIIGGLTAGERVLCLVQNRRVTVLGRGGADASNYVSRLATGSATFEFNTASTTVSKTIDFPPGRFTDTPIVIASPWSSVPQNLSPVTVTGVSVAGATLHLRRSTATNTDVKWIAIQE